MKNRNKYMVFGIVFLVVSLLGLVNLIQAYPAIDEGVELALQTQDKIRVIIEFNQSLSQNILDLIKVEILANLSGSEFLLKQNIENSYWFSGELTREGLEKLRINENIVGIFEEGIGGLADEDETSDGLSEEQIEEKQNLLWLWITIGVIFIIIIYLIIKKKKIIE